jgi:hypothetical protein
LYVPAPDLEAGAAVYRDALGFEEAWRDGDRTVAFWTPDRSAQVTVSTGGCSVRDPRGGHGHGQVAVRRCPGSNYVFDQPGRALGRTPQR